MSMFTLGDLCMAPAAPVPHLAQPLWLLQVGRDGGDDEESQLLGREEAPSAEVVPGRGRGLLGRLGVPAKGGDGNGREPALGGLGSWGGAAGAEGAVRGGGCMSPARVRE